MKFFLVKLLQKRNGLFDRALVLEIIEQKTVMRYFAQRYYRSLLKSYLLTKPRRCFMFKRLKLVYQFLCFYLTRKRKLQNEKA